MTDKQDGGVGYHHNEKPTKLNELPEGTYIMKITDARKWMFEEKNIGGLTITFFDENRCQAYKTSFVYFEANPPRLLEESFAYRQLVEKFLPALGLYYRDIRADNFNKEMFVNNSVSIKMIATKNNPDKTWAAEFNRISDHQQQPDIQDDAPPWEDDIPF